MHKDRADNRCWFFVVNVATRPGSGSLAISNTIVKERRSQCDTLIPAVQQKQGLTIA